MATGDPRDVNPCGCPVAGTYKLTETQFDPVAFLQAQVAKLETQLAAEKEENRRLWAAIGRFSEACGSATAYLAVCKEDSNSEAPGGVSGILENVFNNIDAAQGLIEPEAEEEDE